MQTQLDLVCPTWMQPYAVDSSSFLTLAGWAGFNPLKSFTIRLGHASENIQRDRRRAESSDRQREWKEFFLIHHHSTIEISFTACRPVAGLNIAAQHRSLRFLTAAALIPLLSLLSFFSRLHSDSSPRWYLRSGGDDEEGENIHNIQSKLREGEEAKKKSLPTYALETSSQAKAEISDGAHSRSGLATAKRRRGRLFCLFCCSFEMCFLLSRIRERYFWRL